MDSEIHTTSLQQANVMSPIIDFATELISNSMIWTTSKLHKKHAPNQYNTADRDRNHKQDNLLLNLLPRDTEKSPLVFCLVDWF